MNEEARNIRSAITLVRSMLREADYRVTVVTPGNFYGIKRRKPKMFLLDVVGRLDGFERAAILHRVVR